MAVKEKRVDGEKGGWRRKRQMEDGVMEDDFIDTYEI